LAVAVYVSLWGLALVCEDYFVPAMSKLCRRFDVSDDMAGATLMAMGNSAPQLFISLVSIFITKSSLGLGAAIGTVLFNHLCVCGVCVLNVKEGSIPLDWATLWRDCIFYLLSLVMLVWVLEGSFIEAVLGLRDKDQKNGQVDVHLEGALALVAAYAAYVWVCGNYSRVLLLLGKDPRRRISRRRASDGCCMRLVRTVFPPGLAGTGTGSEWTVLTTEDENGTPLLHQDMLGQQHRGGNFDILSFTDDLETNTLNSQQSRHSSVADKEGEEDGFMCTADFMLDGSVPTLGPLGGELGPDSVSESGATTPSPGRSISGQYQCWLLKHSNFYSKIGVSSRKWQLRFFVLDDTGFYYMRRPGDQKHVKHINIFEAASVRLPVTDRATSVRQRDVDEDMLLFHVVTRYKVFTLRALAPDVYRRLVAILRRRVAIYQSYPEPLRRSMAALQDHHRIGTTGASRNFTYVVLTGIGAVSRASAQALRPLKWAVRRSIPARLRDSTMWNSVSLRLVWTIFACLVWMGFLSYVMAVSCELLGHYLGLTSAVTGLTMVAAGTSFPSLLTSLIVSYQGQGAMAISNAFGSNIFCILIGLGFPWSAVIISKNGRPFDSIQDDGVVASTVFLIFILGGFMFILSSSNFVMQRWLGYVMVFLY
ncbi:unnamed protein product, partial [Ectocarpus fasciculatus]